MKPWQMVITFRYNILYHIRSTCLVWCCTLSRVAPFRGIIESISIYLWFVIVNISVKVVTEIPKTWRTLFEIHSYQAVVDLIKSESSENQTLQYLLRQSHIVVLPKRPMLYNLWKCRFAHPQRPVSWIVISLCCFI